MCPPPVDSSARLLRSSKAPLEPRRPARARLATLLRSVAVLSVGALSACKTAPAPASTSDRFDTFRTTKDWSVTALGGGDVLRVSVLGHEELSSPGGESHLDETGTITLPTIGRLDLSGLTVAEAQSHVKDAYAVYMHEPDVTVEVLRRESNLYHVLGQIREPGPYPLSRPTNALEAVANGGHFLNAADRKHIFLVRPQEEEIEVHEFNAETPGAEGLVQIRPGDIIFVRRRGSQRFQEEFLPLLAPFNIAVPIAIGSGVL